MAERVCPFWIGYFLINPLRRFLQPPEQILAPYLKPGMKALDLGCAMGFFSLPMARMVGESGRVVCVDLQPRMLEALGRRARKAGLEERIEARASRSTDPGLSDLDGQIGFALAFAVVHEIPDAPLFLDQIYRALKPGGRLLVAEPRGHVSGAAFESTVDTLKGTGFEIVDHPPIWRSITALCEKR